MAASTEPPPAVPEAHPPRPGARKRGGRAGRQAWVAFFVLTGPMLAGLLVFKYIAIGWGFLLSFNSARGTIALGNWNGLDNYRQLFASSAFTDSIMVILLFTAFIVPVTFCVSLGLALLVDRLRGGQAFFRTTFFIPAAVSYVVGAAIWKMSLFSGTPSSVANSIAGLFGQEPTAWIATTDPPLFWIVLVTVRLWLQVGLFMILFLAGLQQIPDELYEAARVDGAEHGWKTFRHITFPLLRNTSVAIMLLLIIHAFQAFDEFYNIMGGPLTGGVDPDGRTPLVYLYGVALADQNYGLGSAGAFVLTMIIVVVTLLQGRIAGFGKAREDEK